MQYLKQSTASQPVLLGPFIDDTDGKTAETGLTIANTDIRLSANGGNMFAKTSGGGTHDEAGWYQITLDATDSATVGRLQVSAHVAGALPVFMEFTVLEEAIYDALFAASANAFAGAAGSTDFNTTQKASINTEADTALTDFGKTGYSLTATTGLGNQTANITGNVSGSVGSVTGAVASVTGNVGGNVTGSVGSVVGHTNQTGDTYALANGAAGFVAIDTVVDAIKVITDALGATAAARLALSAGQIITGTVDTVTNTHTPTTTEFQADDITEATADHYNGRIVIFTSGVLAGQATDITDYAAVGGIGQFTVTAMTDAPANNDTFIIV